MRKDKPRRPQHAVLRHVDPSEQSTAFPVGTAAGSRDAGDSDVWLGKSLGLYFGLTNEEVAPLPVALPVLRHLRIGPPDDPVGPVAVDGFVTTHSRSPSPMRRCASRARASAVLAA